jgi:hypothetical protein
MSETEAACRLSIAGFRFQVSGFSLTPALTPESQNDSAVILIKVANTKFPLNGSPKGPFRF